MKNMNLGDRQKMYEQAEAGRQLMPLLPIMARLDGKCFHSVVKDCERPFDTKLRNAMAYVTEKLVEESNAVLGYTQSDEISLILYSDRLESQLFYDGKIQKLASVLASMATFYFQEGMQKFYPEKKLPPAFFDCRVWNVPTKEEACACIVWREIDCMKNAVDMAARCHYSHKVLMSKTTDEKQEMLFQKGINFNDYPAEFKRGVYIQRKKTVRRFTCEEIEKLPEKHEARKNPNLVIERADICKAVFPPLTKVTNKVEVLFQGSEPILRSEKEIMEAEKS